MPARKRMPHTEAWEAIQQMCLWPEQKAYEILRPKSVPQWGHSTTNQPYEKQHCEMVLFKPSTTCLLAPCLIPCVLLSSLETLWKHSITLQAASSLHSQDYRYRFRAVVLFGDPPGERAQETGKSERTLRWQADRFDTEGMVSLFHPTKHQETDDHRSLPPPIRQAIVDLKAEYPDFSLHELAQIIFIQFGRRPSRATIKQVLANGPKPSITERRYARYADISEPFQRRLAVVKLHTEGWMPTAIAKYLDVHHSTVYEALNRFRDEGFAGLDDKSRANKQTVRKVDMATKLEIKKIQENPEIGAFRIRAKLKQMGINLSRATVGRIMA